MDGENEPDFNPLTDTTRIQTMELLEKGNWLEKFVKQGESEKVAAMIKHNASYNTDWVCVLLSACFWSISFLTEFLNLQVGNTLLHFAARNGNHEICKVLLKNGLSKNAKTKVWRYEMNVEKTICTFNPDLI